jgi:hypothetical protein
MMAAIESILSLIRMHGFGILIAILTILTLGSIFLYSNIRSHLPKWAAILITIVVDIIAGPLTIADLFGYSPQFLFQLAFSSRKIPEPSMACDTEANFIKSGENGYDALKDFIKSCPSIDQEYP